MDFDKYLRKYKNVSKQELEKFRDCLGVPEFDEGMFERRVSHLDQDREDEKINGQPPLLVGPLVEVLSISVHPDIVDGNAPMTLYVYGSITAEFYDFSGKKLVTSALYKQDYDDAQLVPQSGGRLTLTSPPYMNWPRDSCMPLGKTSLVVQLFDKSNTLVVSKRILLDEVSGRYEQAQLQVVEGDRGSIDVHYVAIPHALYGRISVLFCDRFGFKNHRLMELNGTIVAHYNNTYGNYSSQSFTIFEKSRNDFQTVGISDNKSLELDRWWLAVPGYSSVTFDLDLSEFRTGHKIVRESVELIPNDGLSSAQNIVLGDIFIQVSMAWFTPNPQGPSERFNNMLHDEGMFKEMDVDQEEESSDDESSSGDDESSSNRNPHWGLHQHKNKLSSSPAIEIFSVFIGGDKSKVLQVFGSAEVLVDDRSFFIFKKDGRNALPLSDCRTIPVLDGSRVFEDCSDLKVKFELKDVDDHLGIKGYIDWHGSVVDSCLCCDKQLCSVIRGRNGFVAFHYSFFSSAVQVNFKFFCNLKMSSDFCVKVYGSVTSRYNYFDYSSEYNKDFYRAVLFKKMQEDFVQLHDENLLPLSRSTIVVPTYSSLIIDVDLICGDTRIVCSKNIEIGVGSTSIETSDCVMCIEMEWGEVK